MDTVLEKYPIEKYSTKGLVVEQSIRNQMPDYLYYRGDINLLQSSVVAVIGSREISERGKAISRNITQALCKREKTILNGLALGCDAEVLRKVVEIGGKGIAVMPCGLDQIYPKTNQELAEEILEKGGCLISEYPVGIKPRKENFVARDRLQALFPVWLSWWNLRREAVHGIQWNMPEDLRHRLLVIWKRKVLPARAMKCWCGAKRLMRLEKMKG